MTDTQLKNLLEHLLKSYGVKVLTEPEESGGVYQAYIEVGGELIVVAVQESEISREDLEGADND